MVEKSNESCNWYVQFENENLKNSIDDIMKTASDIVDSETSTVKYLLSIIKNVKKKSNDILEDLKENIKDCVEKEIDDLEDLILKIEENENSCQQEFDKLEKTTKKFENFIIKDK